MGIKQWFDHFSTNVAELAGRPVVFTLAASMVLIWALSGPLFGFSETWQLVINTGTTIITFLMVFLIQHSENKNTKALHLKIDALISAIDDADDEMIDIENLDSEEIEDLRSKVLTVTDE